MTDVCVIVPEATINIVHNPRFEYDIGGYTRGPPANATTITRSLVRARFGRASGVVVTANAALLEGAYVSTNPNASNVSYTGSAYARGVGRVRARLRDDTNGLQWTSDPIQLNDQRWHRFEVSGVLGSAVGLCTDLRLYIETIDQVQLVTFYVDGFQIENKNYATTYTDGDLELELDRHDGAPYFEWAGRRHDSNSVRTARYRPAGKTVKLTQGLDHRLYPISASGLGMPPINLNVQQFSGQERALVQGSRAMPRAVQLTCWAVKDPVTEVCAPASLKELHRAREALEAVVKPDRVAFDQPFLIRYLDTLGSMDLEAYYESGLEFSGDLRYPFENSFGVRLLCPDPYWKEDSQDSLHLTPARKIILNTNYILMRKDGEWLKMGTGVSAGADVFAILVHSNGDIYAGGGFTEMGGVGDTAYIARWDGTAWQSVGGATQTFNGAVYALAEAPNGDVYAGGAFTTIEAVTFNRIARWEISTETWIVLNAGGAAQGLNQIVDGIAVAADGTMYCCGDFTADLGDPVTLNYVASYSIVTDTFSGIGTLATGLNARTYTVEIDIDGETVYFGGNFTALNGGVVGTYNYVIQYNPSTNTFQNMSILGGGMNNQVRILRRDNEGGVYAGGKFTTAGFANAEKVAYWNRKEWYPLGFDAEGLLGEAADFTYDCAVSDKGLVYFSGEFFSASHSPLSLNLSTWNKTRFSHLDVRLPVMTGSPAGYLSVYAIAIQGDDIYIGFNTPGDAIASQIHNVVINNGTASSWPILDVVGPARLEWLENQDTGAVIKLDLYVRPGEYMFIDFRRGKVRAYSFFRGNVVAGVIADSDVGAFRMLPGSNRIAFLAEQTDSIPGSPGMEDITDEITLRWATRHWSFDAV